MRDILDLVDLLPGDLVELRPYHMGVLVEHAPRRIDAAGEEITDGLEPTSECAKHGQPFLSGVGLSGCKGGRDEPGRGSGPSRFLRG